jgi:pyruvate/2-oxoglutarate dehydrogenase complex dihydrolipoamide dehydrogenase (E3) component
MKESGQYDLVVIGSGSAGSSAAEVAHGYGRSVAIIEQDKVGGDCPNYACVPTKALLHSARVYALLKRAQEFGLAAEQIGFDWRRIVERAEWTIRHTGAASAERYYASEGIALFKGTATFENEHRVRVGGHVLRGEHIMIATGSKTRMPPIEGVEAVKPITHKEAIRLPQLPASLLIVGAGPVGCEFAHLFSTFGVQVTLLQKPNAILSHEEPELAQIVQQTLEENGVRIFTGVEEKLCAIRGLNKTIQAHIGGHVREFSAAEILNAAGRTPQVADLNLDRMGVDTDEKGNVRIDDHLQTTQPRIYAGGDVSGPFLFTHFAHYQGNLAGLNMFSGERPSADYRVVPRVTFTHPEIASVGLTEEEARWAGHRVRVGKFDLRSLGKSLVESEGVGMVKIIGDARSGEILGGHIVAPAAGEMIHEIVAAMVARATVREVADAIHAYPTYAEGIKVAAGEWMNARESQ